MRNAVLLVLAGLVAAAVAAGLGWATLAAPQQEVRRGQEITICHATGNGKYVQYSPDVDSIVSGQGHGEHPEDIIPPFTYEPKEGESGSYPGQNWNDEGQAIWSNGCVAPDPPDPPDPPDCSQTSVAATQDEYTQPESVHVNGTGFSPNETGTFKVVHNTSGSVVASGDVETGSGAFGPLFAWDGANAFEGEHGYRVEASAGTCTTTDTFRYRTVEDPPASLDDPGDPEELLTCLALELAP